MRRTFTRLRTSRNNAPRNGIALCKNAHWLFDNGLWTLSDDYQVMVAVGRFTEHSPDQKASPRTTAAGSVSRATRRSGPIRSTSLGTGSTNFRAHRRRELI